MSLASLRRSLVPLALLTALCAPLGAAAASRAGATVHSSRHIRVYGYLTDHHPATDSILDVYSKTHRTTYHVVVTGATVVKIHTQTVPRSRLQYHMRVIITCQGLSGGKLEALVVHIEFPHPRRKSHA